jgi:hypothetical protein
MPSGRWRHTRSTHSRAPGVSSIESSRPKAVSNVRCPATPATRVGIPQREQGRGVRRVGTLRAGRGRHPRRAARSGDLLASIPTVADATGRILAESEGNDVWLSTDQDRLRAASCGLDKLDNELANAGFLRVHRRYVVNLSRVREVERRDKGELVLVMDDHENTMVRVSWRERARGTPCAGHLRFESRREESHAGEP